MDGSENKKHVTAVILAAGIGSRVGAEVTKQRIEICGHTVLWYTLSAFEQCESVDDVVLVVRECEKADIHCDIGNDFGKIHTVISGGKSRAESAALGFKAIPKDTDYVAFHDGARCLITPFAIDKVVKTAMEKGCASAVSLVTDTIKTVDCDGRISGTIDRSILRRAETPQVFKKSIYNDALNNCQCLSDVTDDNMLVELLGESIFAVDIGGDNLKITTPRDVEYAEFVLNRRREKNV